MILALLLFASGLLASAFFSGIETGYYRVPRIRIVLDARDSRMFSQLWLWFVNRPAAFVSTVLVGNNVANYIVSLGLVMLTSEFFATDNRLLEVLVPVLATPIVFVYGELLPKLMYFQIPSRLLRVNSIPFAIAAFLLIPASSVLYFLGWVLQRLTSYTPLAVRSQLERKELQEMIRESGDVGVLANTQQTLAQNLLVHGSLPISQFCMPIRGLTSVLSTAPKSDIIEIARSTPHSFLLVKGVDSGRTIGYYQISDLNLHADQVPKLHSLPAVPSSRPQLRVFTQLVHARAELAMVVDDAPKESSRTYRREIGVVTTKRLWSLAARRA
jgi:CBS domain containing-hemolysin-like protein